MSNDLTINVVYKRTSTGSRITVDIPDRTKRRITGSIWLQKQALAKLWATVFLGRDWATETVDGVEWFDVHSGTATN